MVWDNPLTEKCMFYKFFKMIKSIFFCFNMGKVDKYSFIESDNIFSLTKLFSDSHDLFFN